MLHNVDLIKIFLVPLLQKMLQSINKQSLFMIKRVKVLIFFMNMRVIDGLKGF